VRTGARRGIGIICCACCCACCCCWRSCRAFCALSAASSDAVAASRPPPPPFPFWDIMGCASGGGARCRPIRDEGGLCVACACVCVRMPGGGGRELWARGSGRKRKGGEKAKTRGGGGGVKCAYGKLDGVGPKEVCVRGFATECLGPAGVWGRRRGRADGAGGPDGGGVMCSWVCWGERGFLSLSCAALSLSLSARRARGAGGGGWPGGGRTKNPGVGLGGARARSRGMGGGRQQNRQRGRDGRLFVFARAAEQGRRVVVGGLVVGKVRGWVCDGKDEAGLG
jgi:hypothetical protein